MSGRRENVRAGTGGAGRGSAMEEATLRDRKSLHAQRGVDSSKERRRRAVQEVT